MSSQLLEYFKSLYYSPVTWALHFHPRLAEFFPHPQPLSSPTGVSGKHNIASSLAICSEVGEAEKIHQWVLWTFWRPRSASFFSINWGNQNLLPCHLRNKKSSLSIIVQYTLGACRNRVCVCFLLWLQGKVHSSSKYFLRNYIALIPWRPRRGRNVKCQKKGMSRVSSRLQVGYLETRLGRSGQWWRPFLGRRELYEPWAGAGRVRFAKIEQSTYPNSAIRFCNIFHILRNIQPEKLNVHLPSSVHGLS